MTERIEIVHGDFGAMNVAVKDADEGLGGIDRAIREQEAKVKPKPRITRRMIEAGAARLLELDTGTNHQELAGAIYAAMWEVRDE